MTNPFVIPIQLPLPVSPSQLALWLAADQIEEADGTLLGSWGDLSFNFSAARQDTRTLRPTFKLNQQNGLPAVVFDAVSNLLLLPTKNSLGFVISRPVSIFFIAKFLGSANLNPIRKGSGASPDTGWKVETQVTGGATDLVEFALMTGGAFTFKAMNVSPLGPWGLVGVTYDGSNNSAGMNFYQNGVLVTSVFGSANSASGSIASPYPPAIGAIDNSNVGGGNWSLGEMMMFTRLLSAAEIAAIHTYAQQKWATP